MEEPFFGKWHLVITVKTLKLKHLHLTGSMISIGSSLDTILYIPLISLVEIELVRRSFNRFSGQFLPASHHSYLTEKKVKFLDNGR